MNERLICAVRVQLLVDFDEDFLGAVLCRGEISECAIGKLEDQAIVPLDQLLEGVRVARQAGGDQVVFVVLKRRGNRPAFPPCDGPMLKVGTDRSRPALGAPWSRRTFESAPLSALARRS